MESELLSPVSVTEPPWPATALELQRALVAWNRRCEEAMAALRADDLEQVEAALASRETLRPQVEVLVRRVHDGDELPREVLSAIRHLQLTAATVDRRLSERLEAERGRLEAELADLGRVHRHPYALSQGPRRRLDIRR